jgi:serine/threonine-protein kinase
LQANPPSPSQVRPETPEELDAICLKCLKKDPGERYSSMEALAQALHHYLVVEASRQDSAASRAPKALLPGYAISGVLGKSGRGVVYKALQASHQRMVSLKVINVSFGQVPRWRAALESASKLRHASIAQIFESSAQADSVAIASEFLGGGTLLQAVRPPVPAAKAASLVATLARAVEFAHQAGVAHGGIKPSNVVCTPEGQPKLTDFGHANDRAVVHAYLAPEQLDSDEPPAPAMDIYALGALLYELITGQPPFRSEITARQIRNDDPILPSRLQAETPAALEAICMRSLRKRPGERYESAAALASELERFGSTGGVKGFLRRLFGA